MKLALTSPLPIDFQKMLQPHFDSIQVGGDLSCADVLIIQLSDVFTKDRLKELKSLKCLVTYSVGVNHVDLESLKERKIPLVHTRGVLTDATADLAWTLILAASRKVKPAMRYLEAGKFLGYSPTLFLGLELRGATLGIIGMGRIGQAVADRAKGFGMQVVFHSSKGGMALAELLKTSDVVSLHCPLNEKTRHLIGENELRLMKEKAILINTARGPVVDEKALVRHLQNNPQFTAGLDVYEAEPVLAPGLLELENAVLLPHIGSATEKTRHDMARICVEEAIRFAKKEPLQYVYPT